MSFGISATGHARTIVSASTQVGAKLPDPVTDAYERTLRIAADVQRMHPGQEALAVAVTAALDAGHDPASDPEVQRIHLAGLLANPGLTGMVEAIAQGQMEQTFIEHADLIVKALVRPFDKAAAVMVDTHSKLGGLALEDTAGVVARGGAAADEWAKGRAATDTLEAINAAWLALANLTRLAPVDSNRPSLRYTDPTVQQWTDLGLTGRKVKPWEAVSLGLPLSLPTMAGYRNRSAALTDGLEAMDAAEVPVDRSRAAVRDWTAKVGAAKVGAA